MSRYDWFRFARFLGGVAIYLRFGNLMTASESAATAEQIWKRSADSNDL